MALRRGSDPRHTKDQTMTNQNEINAIEEAIKTRSAHDLGDALADAGVSTTRRGKRGSDDESCDIPGYGKVFFHDLEQNPGWVVRNYYKDDCDYPVDDCELAAELAEIVEMKKQIM